MALVVRPPCNSLSNNPDKAHGLALCCVILPTGKSPGDARNPRKRARPQATKPTRLLLMLLVLMLRENGSWRHYRLAATDFGCADTLEPRCWTEQRAGPTLDLCWTCAGLVLDRRWTNAGLVLDPCWTCAGPMLA